MARMARVVIPDVPHHVTQRGNRKQRVFFSNSDYLHYKTLLAQYCRKENVAVWAYCLMPNHVHLILVPSTDTGLHRALAETHRRYTLHINDRQNWKGYLWQGRFASYPMDDRYLHAAVRYVELNPVRAKLCDRPENWAWSSANAHLSRKDDGLVKVAPMLEKIKDWNTFLGQLDMATDEQDFQRHERTGRPLGSETFISSLEQVCGRSLRRAKPGPKTITARPSTTVVK